MPYEFLPHASETRLRASGRTLMELFTAALEALTAALKPKLPASAALTRLTIALTAPDVTALLVEFLNQALALMSIHKAACQKVTFKKLMTTELHAVLYTAGVDAFSNDVKAVTYHGAAVKKVGRGWQTDLIFDI